MEDVKVLGEKFVRVCVSVIVHLARGIRSRSAARRSAGAESRRPGARPRALVAYHILCINALTQLYLA